MPDISGRAWLAAGCLVSAGIYLVVRLISHRRFYRNLPGPPHSWFWGHLKLVGEYTTKLPPAGYLHSAITQMKQDYDLPDIFYLDMWPLGPHMLILTSGDAAAIPSTTNNFAMPGVVTKFFAENVGSTFIEATNGPLWKELHQLLAPNLTPKATKAYYHGIVNDARELHGHLDQLAQKTQTTKISTELGRYPFQVISKVFFGKRLSEQAYLDTVRTAELMVIRNTPGALLNPIKKSRWNKEVGLYLGRLDDEIRAIVHDRFRVLQEQKEKSGDPQATSLLDRMLLPRLHAGSNLEAEHVRLILENAKGFIVAGYGTTTDTSTYIWMLLSVFPEVLKKLREEHVRVFGNDLDRTLEILQENPNIINSLEYTTAVIQETLRLYPIGMSVREAPAHLTSFEHKGTTFPLLPQHMFCIVTQTLHYRPDVFEDPKRFWPERFLGPGRPVPRNVYRPFERGVRGCLGQTLAMDEMKISLVMLARWFDFELVDHNPHKEPLFGFTDLDTKLGKHAFQVHAFAALASGTVNMRIQRAKSS